MSGILRARGLPDRMKARNGAVQVRTLVAAAARMGSVALPRITSHQPSECSYYYAIQRTTALIYKQESVPNGNVETLGTLPRKQPVIDPPQTEIGAFHERCLLVELGHCGREPSNLCIAASEEQDTQSWTQFTSMTREFPSEMTARPVTNWRSGNSAGRGAVTRTLTCRSMPSSLTRQYQPPSIPDQSIFCPLKPCMCGSAHTALPSGQAVHRSLSYLRPGEGQMTRLCSRGVFVMSRIGP